MLKITQVAAVLPMKAYWEVEEFLISALGAANFSGSHSGRFNTAELFPLPMDCHLCLQPETYQVVLCGPRPTL